MVAHSLSPFAMTNSQDWESIERGCHLSPITGWGSRPAHPYQGWQQKDVPVLFSPGCKRELVVCS